MVASFCSLKYRTRSFACARWYSIVTDLHSYSVLLLAAGECIVSASMRQMQNA